MIALNWPNRVKPELSQVPLKEVSVMNANCLFCDRKKFKNEARLVLEKSPEVFKGLVTEVLFNDL